MRYLPSMEQSSAHCRGAAAPRWKACAAAAAGSQALRGAPPHRPFPRSPRTGGGTGSGVRQRRAAWVGAYRRLVLTARRWPGVLHVCPDSLSSRFQTQVEIAYLRRFKRTATDCTALPCAASPRPSDARASASPAPPYARTDASRGSDRLRSPPRCRVGECASERATP